MRVFLTEGVTGNAPGVHNVCGLLNYFSETIQFRMYLVKDGFGETSDCTNLPIRLANWLGMDARRVKFSFMPPILTPMGGKNSIIDGIIAPKP